MTSSVIVAKDGFVDFPLLAILRRRNVCQSELARRTGIKPTYISRLIHGKTNPTWKTIMVIAAALELDLGDLGNER
jgi:transcriptional regulator with XRE-family HTH domain